MGARLGRVIAVFTVGCGVVAFSACGNGHHATPPPTTTSPASSTTTTGSTTTVTTAATPTTLAGTTTAPPTTTPASTGAHVSITGFTASPPGPVSCTAPTMVELQWTMTGASHVTLTLDGAIAATYPAGAQDHLEYLPCDGRTHTYALSAGTGGSVATASRTVATRVTG